MKSRSKSRLACVLCVSLVCAAALICMCALLLTRMHRCCADDFTHAAVAADSLTCSHIGRDILLEGGSAVDAAISALLCTSLINPQSMGIGGGAIFTIMDKDGDVSVINSRETVPKNFPPDLLKKCRTSLGLGQVGGDWIGVPGELRGYAAAHDKFGKLPWERLFKPIIKLAREGFPVPVYLSSVLKNPLITKLVQSTSLCQLFCHENKTVFAKHIMDPDFAHYIRSIINISGTHPASYYNVTPSTDLFGTTHVSVLASDGSAVSVTSTINHFFGSGVVSPKTGIILNNELADFCGRADSVSAGEQPPSSMSPVIIRSKHREKVLIIGGSGGSQIITAIATAIMNKLWFGMNLEDAIKDKVVFVNSSNSVLFEPGFDKSMMDAMQTFGHDVKYNPWSLNVVNGIMKEHHCISAVSDRRKHAKASGY
ncbi:Glutathione hydrolase 5 proenzyme [Bagarius yarrelli]|uniref:Glutathione hydrolase 5 proenzyme n=1 Tax=Bagarius yarrelli TaxID=175774 RepID=A0A556U2U7_BAGYA|nr:Glutathione hydrolase 5 proenzyme [Bagarius yarrelli]